jgi:hypothetical protein
MEDGRLRHELILCSQDQPLVELVGHELLEISAHALAQVELLAQRVGRDEVEHIELASSDTPVPRTGASATQHDHSLGLDPALAEKAPDEWEPVEKLVTDLTRERSHDDRHAGAEIALEASACVAEAHLATQRPDRGPG